MLTLGAVLSMPTVRSGQPDVLVGQGELNRAVRWVHTTELADIGPLLRGGDLVLTTGIALPDRSEELADFAASLTRSGAAGLVLELGRRWQEVPQDLLAACVQFKLPLVALRREVRFAAVAQAVGERLVDEQLSELREAKRVHETFTELSVSEAGPEEILAAVQQLSGATVVLENEQHQVLDFRAGPNDPSDLLDDWTRRSIGISLDGRTVWDESNGWLVTRVGRRERGWGRLVIEASSRPPERLVAVAERAAAALAMHRLHGRSKDSHRRRLHQELLSGLMADASDADLNRRAVVAGIPKNGCRLAGLSLRPPNATSPSTTSVDHQLDDLVAAMLHSAAVSGFGILIAVFEGEVRALLAVPVPKDLDASVDHMVEQVQRKIPCSAAVGAGVDHLELADRTLKDAVHIRAALSSDVATNRVYRLVDLHVRGLLALLSDDERLIAFADRELRVLRTAKDPTMLETARVVVEHWGNKSQAAAILNVSRPILYERIARLERLLGASLTDAEVRTSVHVALLFEQSRNARGPLASH